MNKLNEPTHKKHGGGKRDNNKKTSPKNLAPISLQCCPGPVLMYSCVDQLALPSRASRRRAPKDRTRGLFALTLTHAHKGILKGIKNYNKIFNVSRFILSVHFIFYRSLSNFSNTKTIGILIKTWLFLLISSYFSCFFTLFPFSKAEVVHFRHIFDFTFSPEIPVRCT